MIWPSGAQGIVPHKRPRMNRHDRFSLRGGGSELNLPVKRKHNQIQMAPTNNTLSVNEVAVVTDTSPRAVNEVVDNQVLPRRFIVRGRGRALLPQACYLVAVYWGTSDRLTKTERVHLVNRLSDEFGRSALPTRASA